MNQNEEFQSAFSTIESFIFAKSKKNVRDNFHMLVALEAVRRIARERGLLEASPTLETVRP